MKQNDDWFLSLLDEQVLLLRNSTETDYHESIRVWQSWRNEEVPFYGTVGEMPLEVAIGYTYLASKYGKRDLTPHASAHEQAVQAAKAVISMVG